MASMNSYQNDGSGRDTFINHAGAYWLNPLPGGTFYKSTARTYPNGRSVDSIDPFASVRPPGRTLFGQSRYGTTVLPSSGAATARDGVTHADDTTGGNDTAADAATMAARGDGAGVDDAGMTTTGGGPGGDETFDAAETALLRLPDDVPRPERRLWQPGHATSGLTPTDGSTFNGVATNWAAPREVDSTLLRVAPTYESTCHYGLRTGRFYTDDQAPPHMMTLPEKGTTWGKSRYY